MATKTVTHISDDLDSSTEDVDTVKFSLFGANYEIDLSKENQEKLNDALTPFLDKARKAGGTASTSRRTSTPKAPADPSAPSAKEIRSWAAEQNIDVPARGRIPSSVVDQFKAAH